MTNIIDVSYVEQHGKIIQNYEAIGRERSKLLLRTAETSLNKQVALG